MNKNEILLRRKQKVVVPARKKGDVKLSPAIVASVMRNIQNIGYTFSTPLIERVSLLPFEQFESFYRELEGALKKMIGAHRKYRPLYPNFPEQVMDEDSAQIYLSVSTGQTSQEDLDKETLKVFAEENIRDLKVIDLGTDNDLKDIAHKLMGAKTSISQTDKEDLSWIIQKYKRTIADYLPEDIPHKEVLTFTVGELLKEVGSVEDLDLAKYFKTSTDALRLAVALSGGDVSLAEKTKFRNLKRSERRMLLGFIESSGSFENITEDMLRHKTAWIRLGEKIHPSEYSKAYPKTAQAFDVLRNKKTFYTFNSKVEHALQTMNYEKAVELLSTRPGDFARRLDHVLRISQDKKKVAESFAEVVTKVSTPVLLQVLSHFQNRNSDGLRAVFPKGSLSKVMALETPLKEIDETICAYVVGSCRAALILRFKELPEMGKVYIDEKLNKCLVPFSQRSASKSLKTLVRGSKIPMDEGDFVRFFIWWKNGSNRVDIDLTTFFCGENWEQLGYVSYSHTSSPEFGVQHSGDITNAPNGASEFIDVDLKKAFAAGCRYVVMNVYSFSSQPFCDLPECFAGWMVRNEPIHGKKFDGRTVQDKVDLTADTKVAIPVILDLKEREAIWVDLSLKSNARFSARIEENKEGVALTSQALVEMKKPSLYELFLLHATSRGEIVKAKEDADIVFSLDGDVTPFDLEEIMSEYL